MALQNGNDKQPAAAPPKRVGHLLSVGLDQECPPEATERRQSAPEALQGQNQPNTISAASRGCKKNLPQMRISVISCGYDLCMETNQTFTSHNTTFKIVELKQHNADFTAQLGWSHFAAVQRLNGRKIYFTNLFIVDGEIINSNVVM